MFSHYVDSDKKIKWLVYGAGGWIGTQLVDLLRVQYTKDVVVAALARGDDEDGVGTELDKVQPTHVVVSIGRTFGESVNTIDYLEGGPDKLHINLRDNLLAPLIIARQCSQRDMHCTYIGTGCIFDSSSETFREASLPNFFGSSYSCVKGTTDQLIAKIPNVLNTRIRMPITGSPSPRNFITKIVGYPNIYSVDNSMTVLPDLLPHLIHLARTNVTGTLNLVNPGTINHEEILHMYRDAVDPTFVWNRLKNEEELNQTLACARSNNRLDTELLVSLCPGVQEVKQAVLQQMVEYAKTSVRHVAKNVLVTGGAGFIGSHLIEQLYNSQLDYHVIVNYDSLTYAGSKSNIPEYIQLDSKRYVFVQGDVCDYRLLYQTVCDHRIDTIIHMAADTHVDKSFTDPFAFNWTNVYGTLTVLTVARDCPHQVQRVVYMSTDEVYGSTNEKNTEECIMEPTNPYSASKAGGELQANAYFKSFNVPVIIVRGNNAIGPRQHREKVLPKFINQRLAGQPLTIHGSGHNLRSFIHVTDVVRAIELLVRCGENGETYNVGSGEEVSITALAKIICSMVPLSPPLPPPLPTAQTNESEVNDCLKKVEQGYIFTENRVFNDCRYYIDDTKIRRLGWRPTITNPIDSVVQWHLAIRRSAHSL